MRAPTCDDLWRKVLLRAHKGVGARDRLCNELVRGQHLLLVWRLALCSTVPELSQAAELSAPAVNVCSRGAQTGRQSIFPLRWQRRAAQHVCCAALVR